MIDWINTFYDKYFSATIVSQNKTITTVTIRIDSDLFSCVLILKPGDWVVVSINNNFVSTFEAIDSKTVEAIKQYL